MLFLLAVLGWLGVESQFLIWLGLCLLGGWCWFQYFWSVAGWRDMYGFFFGVHIFWSCLQNYDSRKPFSSKSSQKCIFV